MITSTTLCECGSELILCSKLEDDFEKEIYLCIFTSGQFNSKPTIWNRLKYCFYHLKTGKKYEDQIMLSFDKAQQLGNWLIENSND